MTPRSDEDGSGSIETEKVGRGEGEERSKLLEPPEPANDQLTFARICHVCGETYLAARPAPFENGQPPLGCCHPCERKEYAEDREAQEALRRQFGVSPFDYREP